MHEDESELQRMKTYATPETPELTANGTMDTMHEDESELQRVKTYATPETPELTANGTPETEGNHLPGVLHAALDRLNLEENTLRKCEGLLARLQVVREASDSVPPADSHQPPPGTIAAPLSVESLKHCFSNQCTPP